MAILREQPLSLLLQDLIILPLRNMIPILNVYFLLSLYILYTPIIIAPAFDTSLTAELLHGDIFNDILIKKKY